MSEATTKPEQGVQKRLALRTDNGNGPLRRFDPVTANLPALAGIPKRDERRRTVDVHAMRTTFGTLLRKAGVYPRTAQAAMRHSTIDLTMNV